MKRRFVTILTLTLGFVLLFTFPAIASYRLDGASISATCDDYTIRVWGTNDCAGREIFYWLTLYPVSGGDPIEIEGSFLLPAGKFDESRTFDWPVDVVLTCGSHDIVLEVYLPCIYWVEVETDLDCPCVAGCRVTAGGNKDGVYCPLLRNGDPDPEYCYEDEETDDITHTWGGQAGAPPRVDGNWTHKYLSKETRPHNKFTFHSNDLFYIQCSDPGEFCQPARFAPNRQIDFSGIGRFTNTSGAFKNAPDGDLCFKVHLEDIGEPGPGGRWPNAEEPCAHCPGTEIVEPDCTDCTDYYEIEIYDSPDHNIVTGECLGNLIWQNGDEVSTNCTGGEPYVAPFAPYEGFFTRAGNVQIHPDNNGP